MIMKKYENPMLQVISIKRSNIIATSGNETMNYRGDFGSGITIAAPGMRGLDDYYEGY